MFYNVDDADPNVIAADEATKDVVSETDITSSASLLNPTLTQQIDVPVLVIVGEDDQIFCGPLASGGTFSCSSGQAIQAQEAAAYAPRAQLQACVVPGSGHDLNLSLDHDLVEADAITWSYEYFGRSGVPRGDRRQLPPDCSR